MKKLSFENILNEMVFPSFLRNTLNMLGVDFKKEFLQKITGILGRTLDQVSEAEFYTALKSAAMADERRIISKKIVERNFERLKNIFESYDLTIAQQSANAGKQIEEELNINPALLRDVRSEYKLEAARRGEPVTQAAQPHPTQTAQPHPTQTTAQQVTTTSRYMTPEELNREVMANKNLPGWRDIYARSGWEKLTFKERNDLINNVYQRADSFLQIKTYDEMLPIIDDLLNKARKNYNKGLETELLATKNGASKGGRQNINYTDPTWLRYVKGVVKSIFYGLLASVAATAAVGGAGYWAYKKYINPTEQPQQQVQPQQQNPTNKGWIDKIK